MNAGAARTSPARDGLGSGPFHTRFYAHYNIGAQNPIYSGGDRASYLMLPVIPV
jgi:hypothetical protein